MWCLVMEKNNFYLLKSMEVQQVLLGEIKRVVTFLCGWKKRTGKNGHLQCLPPFFAKNVVKMVLKTVHVSYALDATTKKFVGSVESITSSIEGIDDIEYDWNDIKFFAQMGYFLYVVGRLEYNNSTSCSDGTIVREYNPWTATWNIVCTLAQERHSPLVVPLDIEKKKKRLGIFGGWLNNVRVNTCELIDCSTKISTPLATLSNNKYIFDAKKRGNDVAIAYSVSCDDMYVCLLSIGAKEEIGTTHLLSDMIGAQIYDTFWVGNKLHIVFDNGAYDQPLPFLLACKDATTTITTPKPYDVICFDIETWTFVSPDQFSTNKYLERELDSLQNNVATTLLPPGHQRL
jgi:hypothetical protein